MTEHYRHLDDQQKQAAVGALPDLALGIIPGSDWGQTGNAASEKPQSDPIIISVGEGGTCIFFSNAPANIVGYYNLNISTGDNLVANQFSYPDNTLDSVLTNGVATGSTFSEWDPVADHLLPVSIYNGSIWSINYTFGPNGVGGVLNSPSAATVTFVGTVVNIDTNGIYTFTPPAYGPGTYLLALAAPPSLFGLGGATFEEIVGRAPDIGESVRTLNAATQVYSTTTFDGSAWNNGAPSLAIGQAAYFNLSAVAEPSTLALVGLGAAALVIFRRRNSQA